MSRASWGVLFALLWVARVEAQAVDGGSDASLPLSGLDGGLDGGLGGAIDGGAVVADASARSDSGARDAGPRDAGALDLDLPEQGCHLAHAGDLGGALPLLLALASLRRRARQS